MKSDRWQQIEQLYYAALECEAGQRAAFLDEACGGDEELRREVESLLASHEQAGEFLASPALEVAAKLIAEDQFASAVGRSIGHYQILSLLGVGGMGEVYLAQDTRLDRQIALKLLPVHFTQDADRMRRFVQEAKAASAFSHPNVAHIYEIGEAEGVSFIAMEYVEGQTLEAKINGQPLETGEILDIAAQVADALEEAHAKGIIHRDIKPGNVMVTARGQVKVLDFGLAKMTRHERGRLASDLSTQLRTQPGLLMGTVPYMSPEQALGHEVDHRTDIFSLGVVLYEMATGRRPFTGTTTGETLDAIIHAEPEAIVRFNANAPAELERIIRKCLEKDRERRYQSAHELLIDLRNLKRAIESGAAAAAVASQVRGRRLLASRQALALAAVVVLAVAALIYALLFRGVPAPPQPEIKSLAVLPFKSLNQEVKEDYLGLGIASEIITKVSQIGALTVRPTSAVRKYATQEIDALQAARELKVDAVLDSTFLHVGEQLRVSVNLLRVQDGVSLWADSFDMRFSDIFAIQDEVARQVAQRLRLQLSPAQQAQLTNRYTSSADAYDYYLKAMHSYEKWNVSRAELDSAIAKFKKAIEIDPKYALAYAQLAGCYTTVALFFEPEPIWLDRAGEAMNQASALDPNLAELHLVRAQIFWSLAGGYRIEEAIREMRLAQQLNPSVGHEDLGVIYNHLGFEEQSIRELKRAIEIDPTSVVPQDRLAEAYVWFGKYEEAIVAYDRVIAIEPNNLNAYQYGALPFLYKNQFDEAQRRLERALALNPRSHLALSYRGLLLALKGQFKEAEAQIPEIIQRGQKFRSYHHATYAIACIFALEGKRREAVEWLRKTVEYGMPNYPMFARDPFLDRIRKDPEFIQFMNELKIKWEGYQREFE